MSVDYEAIAQRGRCDVSSLRLAEPLLEQGYTAPFLARYRRDELGGLDESSLWALSAAIKTEQKIAERRDELHAAWQQTSLCDPAIGQAIQKSSSLRMLARLGRRLKSESNEQSNAPALLAVRVLNPQKGDGSDFTEIAQKVEGIQDASAAVEGLEQALVKRLAGDPRVIAFAVRWLVKNAQIRIASVSDPHTPQEEPASKKSALKVETSDSKTDAGSEQQDSPKDASSVHADAANESAKAANTDTKPAVATVASDESGTPVDPATETPAVEAAQKSEPTSSEAAGESGVEAAADPKSDASAKQATIPQVDSAGDATVDAPPEAVTPEVPAPSPATEKASSTEQTASAADEPGIASPESTSVTAEGSPPAAGGEVDFTPETDKQDANKKASGKKKKTGKAESKAPKKQKKVSPRQRRRRWLVSVLKPLAGKRFACDKLSAFQVVMLGRALRSQVAECSFEYDATKLVAELQRTAVGLNRHVESVLREIVLANEAVIREAAEAAWWDDLHERASARLVTITADHLRRQVNRGAVEAKVVMAVDAVGPRTAATSIVAADGRLLHKEDLPCQLSSATRSQAVARMGELIHAYHVDLLVISNGPARRATMIALSDLIGQSPEKSVRWTLADRSGADVYASSAVADEEMRSTPRRFRAAAWLAFSVLQPAQALAKVDPLKLRLSSFQRELSDDAMLSSLEDVLVSGASRGGVDANAAPVSWLQRLPGVQEHVAQSIDKARRESLFNSRQSIVDLDEWGEATHSRQAIPFLRVFGSEEVLDGTLIHPDDYPLARKLANALDLELPPDFPPGYVSPDFTIEPEPAAAKLVEATAEPEKSPVEDFSAAAESAPEFQVDQETASSSDGPQSSEADEQTPAAEADAESTEAGSSGKPCAETPEAETPEVAGSAEAVTRESHAVPADESPSAAEAATPEPAAEASSAARTVATVDIADRIRRARPEQAKIDRCVKEWQIGAKRAEQLVQWLCDPFGDSDSTGYPPAVLSTMPSIKDLKPGDSVIGVVVGVMPFGVFVELAPDCSGLIHVSRVADSYVEDLHEAVQVGDVLTAWVTGIDEKRRRVALSAVSPQREAELQEARRRRDDRSRGGQARGGQSQGGQSQGGQSQGGQSQGGQARGGQARGGQSQGGQGRGDRAGASGGRPGGGRGRDQGGGRSRDGGRGRGRDGRGGRGKQPESYRVVGKKETKPISDAMQKGEEPLRSFGDLMQFFDSPPAVEEQQPEKQAEKSKPKQVEASDSQDDAAAPASPVSTDGERPTIEVGDGGSETPSEETGGSAVASQPAEEAIKSKDQDGPDSSPAADTPTS